MASPTFTVGDTWPYLRGAAKDEDGLLDLTAADVLECYLVSAGHTVHGVAPNVVGDTPPVDVGDPASSVGFNWHYVWQSSDTAFTGTYTTWLKVTWDSGATPPSVEYFKGDTFTIQAAPS